MRSLSKSLRNAIRMPDRSTVDVYVTVFILLMCIPCGYVIGTAFGY